MTKAPFSVEWLSQSSQALKSPTEGSPRRPSPAGRRPGSGSSPGLSERSKEQSAGAGRGGRSRERLAAPPAAGNRRLRGRRGIPVLPRWEGEDGRARAAPRARLRTDRFGGCPEAKEAGGHPRGSRAWLTPFSLPPPCPQEQASSRGARGSPRRRGVPSAPAPRSPAAGAGGGCARPSAPSSSAPWRAPSSGSSTWGPPSAASWPAGCGSRRCR